MTIPAPPGAVWPWLVQMGCDRGGWYAWDLLDNGGRPSATRIVPELQGLAEGDVIPGWPGRRGGMTVVRLVPRELLLLDWAGAGLRFTWAFALRAEGADATRLVARARVALPRRLGPLALAGRAILPGHDVLQRRQLLAIRARATRSRILESSMLF